MQRHMLKSKIHRATVTETDLNYTGSITIDEELMEKADLLENEKVAVLNIDNGARFETYVIGGKRGSGKICLNGAAARLVQAGDKIIILSYVCVDENEVNDFTPLMIHMNERNTITDGT